MCVAGCFLFDISPHSADFLFWCCPPAGSFLVSGFGICMVFFNGVPVPLCAAGWGGKRPSHAIGAMVERAEAFFSIPHSGQNGGRILIDGMAFLFGEGRGKGERQWGHVYIMICSSSRIEVMRDEGRLAWPN